MAATAALPQRQPGPRLPPVCALRGAPAHCAQGERGGRRRQPRQLLRWPLARPRMRRRQRPGGRVSRGLLPGRPTPSLRGMAPARLPGAVLRARRWYGSADVIPARLCVAQSQVAQGPEQLPPLRGPDAGHPHRDRRRPTLRWRPPGPARRHPQSLPAARGGVRLQPHRPRRLRQGASVQARLGLRPRWAGPRVRAALNRLRPSAHAGGHRRGHHRGAHAGAAVPARVRHGQAPQVLRG